MGLLIQAAQQATDATAGYVVLGIAALVILCMLFVSLWVIMNALRDKFPREQRPARASVVKKLNEMEENVRALSELAASKQ